MNRPLTCAILVLACMCLPIDRSQACPTSPDVYISDWLHYIPLGSNVTLEADEYSGTNITDWYWSYNSNVTVVDSDDEYGTYPTSSRTFSFSAAGTYYLWAEAENNYYLTDNDYGKVYVVEVSSVKQSGTGATSIYVPVSTNVSLQAYPYPNTSWPSGKPTWSIQTQPGGASASVTAGSSGSATLSNMTVAGLYKPKAVCGSADDGATMDVTAFDVQLDTTFPKTIPLGGTLALACTPKPDGITGGSITWSKASGPGTVTFTPGADSEDPNFSASAAGSYSVQVQYTKDGATASKTSGTIAVLTVDITAPSPFPTYVAKDTPIQLDCTPSLTGPGEAYHWFQAYGTGAGTFSNAYAKNPTFTPTVAGSYVLRLEYTLNGVTVSDMKSTVIVGVEISEPLTFPAYVQSGAPLQLDCTPQCGTGTDYVWSKVSGPGTVTFSYNGETNNNVKDPTFTASTAGDYTVQVQCKVNGITVSDISETITAVYMSVQSDLFIRWCGETADIDYVIQPTNLSDYTVTLIITDADHQTIIRSESLTSQGLGSQHTTWDGRWDEDPNEPWTGVCAWPDEYRAVIELRLGPGGEQIFTCESQIIVESVGLSVSLTTADDLQAARSEPGFILPKNLEGDGPWDHYALLRVSVEPPEWFDEVELSVDDGGRLRIWDEDSWFTSRTYPSGWVPGIVVPWIPSFTVMLIDGLSPGPVTISVKCRYAGVIIDEDYANVYVTETTSHCPKGTTGHVWMPTSESELNNPDAYTFETELETNSQGYTIGWYRDDNTLDDEWPECSLANYKSLSGDSVLHVIGTPDGYISTSYYGAAYASTMAGAEAWIGSEVDMDYHWDPVGNEPRYVILVGNFWHEQNFQPGLTEREAIVHWAYGNSDPIKEAAGGRWRVGYTVDGFAGSLFTPTTQQLLERMNGTSQTYGGTRRTAGEAWGVGDFPDGVVMSGNPWTTLCPAPAKNDATWPTCIIFDTYMDTSYSAEDAIVLVDGGSIGSPQWFGDIGYGAFIIGFSSEGTGTVRADADSCISNGKQMDGNRIAPNGDDVEWQF